jgi:predicted PhzF superfamily epimerase YddE/YHI9
VRFETLSGTLTATRIGNQITMDFPAQRQQPCEPLPDLVEAMGVQPIYIGRNCSDILVEVATQREVEQAEVDFARLGKINVRGVILTAISSCREFDFVSRFFAPASGVNEDPVTGSAHACLAPFWGDRLNKTQLVGYQASRRGGYVHTCVDGDRVQLSGQAVTVLRGVLLA